MHEPGGGLEMTTLINIHVHACGKQEQKKILIKKN